MDHSSLNAGLQKCSYPDLARRDITTALQTYRDLRPTVDSFVFNDGSNKDLLALEGTIPVSYKGSTYNIPVCVWLMDTHPYNSPLVYVKPTQTMQIRPGRYVDSNGKVALPYLRDWRYPNSTIFGLLQVLAVVFSEETPVFSRSAAPARPPYPPTHAGGQPPYPMGGAAQPPYPMGGGSTYPMPMPSMPSAGGYPAYPPTSQSTAYPRPQYQYPPTNTPYPPVGGYPSSNPPYPPSNPPTSAAAGGYPGYPPTPVTAANTSQTSAQPAGLSDEAIRASVLSAVEDKMRRKLMDMFQQHSAEYGALQRTQDDLNRGKAKLEEMLTKLKEEQDKADMCIITLNEKNTELSQVIGRQESQKDINVEDAVDTTAPLYRQLVKLFAEEQAIEDALYYLGKALGNGVIELEVFLKKVRELSRKQFTLRALINKCRQKAGLA